MKIVHQPVLKAEVFEWLRPEGDGGLLIDATLGEGGHGEMFLKACPTLSLIGIDADPQVLSTARLRLAPFAEGAPGRVRFFETWFDQFFKTPASGEKADRILLDLGISIFHYAGSGRGFSLTAEEPLDMRLNPGLDLTAGKIVNSFSEKKLADIFFRFGEEPMARRFARAIVMARAGKPVSTARELGEILRRAAPEARRHRRIHPATGVFMALRIVVNSELDRLESALENAVGWLKPGGRIGVISFHSLEDRLVKTFFKGKALEPETGDGAVLRILTKKPIIPGEEERVFNPPSRSAKFRVAEKI
ncbi:MAG: 16S rRNA (cytosine(1402)-N(4))-methyltransferase RsmH [Spirochaetales bacterium]|jgi:16S rRNA (cytosine1402-N4)-methyltransferase|nr:16S rRNA (cytosine(1402)-N(4))-methyltransferase RsmH [Spirochaetales bacterium]